METVTLNPVPGFCVKSRVTNDTHLTASGIHVQKGSKVFVNVAWDPNVPPPPPHTDDVVKSAIQGLDIDTWFVPIVVSDPHQDFDKAGQPAIVFDSVLNPTIKSRTVRDPDFKKFIIELAFQRIEAQTTLILSRLIATPNIASKGKPRSRRVLVPAAVFPPGQPDRQAPPLVQEITNQPASVPEHAPVKGILKNHISNPQIPVWSWTQQGSSIRIVFIVPAITHSNIPACTLDVEPRRILLHVPGLYDLDVNLDSPDSELISVFGKNDTADEALDLKRMRSLNVDNARAEWRVADRTIILLA